MHGNRRRSASSSPVFTLSAADGWLSGWLAGAWLLGWARVAGGGAWEERARSKEEVCQQQKQIEERERPVGGGSARRLREGEREEEIRGGKITVLPFPYLYRFRDSPNLNAARLIRKPIPKPKSII